MAKSFVPSREANLRGLTLSVRGGGDAAQLTIRREPKGSVPFGSPVFGQKIAYFQAKKSKFNYLSGRQEGNSLLEII